MRVGLLFECNLTEDLQITVRRPLFHRIQFKALIASLMEGELAQICATGTPVDSSRSRRSSPGTRSAARIFRSSELDHMG